jgi:FkbM family methyltransferase
VIDVGVGSGTWDLYEQFPASKHLLVEPLEECRSVLDDIAGKYNAQYVLAAAGREPGTTEIRVHRVPACSSTIGPREGEDGEAVPRVVPVVRLDDICGERGLPGSYLIKVDVEGAELNVLDGSGAILDDTEVVLLEVSLFRFWPDAPLFHDVVAYMKARGFVVYDLYGGHLRPIDGALAQVDVAFVKDQGPFRRLHSYASADQADRLYRSWGY